MKRNLSFDDFTALRYLEGIGAIMTHQVARTLGYDRVSGDRATPRARALLRRLERWGYVGSEKPRLYGNVIFWNITDEGREAVAR
jgi:hypothetical protein